MSLESQGRVECDFKMFHFYHWFNNGGADSKMRNSVSRPKTRIKVYDFGLFWIAFEAILGVAMYNIINAKLQLFKENRTITPSQDYIKLRVVRIHHRIYFVSCNHIF